MHDWSRENVASTALSVWRSRNSFLGPRSQRQRNLSPEANRRRRENVRAKKPRPGERGMGRAGHPAKVVRAAKIPRRLDDAHCCSRLVRCRLVTCASLRRRGPPFPRALTCRRRYLRIHGRSRLDESAKWQLGKVFAHAGGKARGSLSLDFP